MTRVLALISTILARKRSCERVLVELSQQSRPPDGVILRLDGYADAPPPTCPLLVEFVERTKELSGAGGRWLFVERLLSTCGCKDPSLADTIIVNIDDDMVLREAPLFVDRLVQSVILTDNAAASAGRTSSGASAPPTAHSAGALIYAGGHGLSFRAERLRGLAKFYEDFQSAGGPLALGLRGDDDAFLSAFLWRQNISITHAGTGNTFSASRTQESSQTALKRALGVKRDAQKELIKKITGWPWAPQY